MTNIDKVDDFLKQAGVFYLTTVSAGKPKCRPIGFHMEANNTIYFGVGEFKEVFNQMQENPNVEICATVEKNFLRFYGKAVFESNYKITEKVLAAAPSMQQIYNEKTGYKLGIFHLEGATAEFRSMMGITESYTF